MYYAMTVLKHLYLNNVLAIPCFESHYVLTLKILDLKLESFVRLDGRKDIQSK